MDDLGRIGTEEKLFSLILKGFWTSSNEDGQDTGAEGRTRTGTYFYG